MSILDYIESIPLLLKFFIPGAICLTWLSFLRGKKEKSYEYFIFKCVVISGLIAYPLQAIYAEWNDFILFVCTIVIGVISAFIYAKILNSDKLQAMLQKLHIRKTTRNFWDDVIDMDHGTYGEVKLKNDDRRYYGTVEYLEDKEEGDIYIAITDYTIITKEGQKISQDDNVRLVFNTADAERVIFKSAHSDDE